MREQKRDQLVEKALEVFQSRGFHATGVDAVASHAGMSKTSIYNHFGGKDALVEAALALQAERTAEAIDARAGDAGSPAAEILAVFDALGDWMTGEGFEGCAFIKAAAEYQDPASPVRAAAAAAKAAIGARIDAALARMALKTDERTGARRRLLILIDGAIVRTQMGLDPEASRVARAMAEGQVNALAALSDRRRRRRAQITARRAAAQR